MAAHNRSRAGSVHLLDPLALFLLTRSWFVGDKKPFHKFLNTSISGAFSTTRCKCYGFWSD